MNGRLEHHEYRKQDIHGIFLGCTAYHFRYQSWAWAKRRARRQRRISPIETETKPTGADRRIPWTSLTTFGRRKEKLAALLDG
jgi:hypothetical protein